MRGVFFTVINNGLEVYNLLVPLKSANVNQEQKGNCLLIRLETGVYIFQNFR